MNPEDVKKPAVATPEVDTKTQPETGEQETFDREYVEKLRRENASYRTKAKEAQEAAEAVRVTAEREKMGEVDRLKAELADRDKAIQEARAAQTAAERRAALTGKVADAGAALKLLDAEAHLAEDGSVNVDAFLKDYPFLTPEPPARPSTVSGSGKIATNMTNPWARETLNLTEQGRITTENPTLAAELKAAANERK